MIVLGAGVIGVEYACIFAALGIAVTLVDTRDRLLPYRRSRDRGTPASGSSAGSASTCSTTTATRRSSGFPATRRGCAAPCAGAASSRPTSLLYCVGRDGNTKGLGLEAIGLEPNEYGLLDGERELPDRDPHIYAVGDVIGYPALASTSMEQGRQAMRHAFDIPGRPRRRRSACRSRSTRSRR